MEPADDGQHPVEIANILRLQHRLKQEFMLKETQSAQKGRLRQMIDEQIKTYYSSEVRNISHGHGQLLEDEGFGDCYNFVKEVLLLVARDHKFLITVLESASKQDHDSVGKLIDPIVNVFYENLVEGDEFYKDITKIVIDIQEEELSGAKLSWLKQEIIERYLHRAEYRHYASLAVRNTLINICEDEPTYGIPRSEGKSSSEYESLLLNFDIKKHVIEGLPSSEIIDKIKFSTKDSWMSERRRSSVDQLNESNVDSERWLVLVLEEYISDIFASVYRMPIGLKIICKSMQLHMAKAEPPVPRESILSRVWKYIFHLFYDNLQFNDKFMGSQFATQQRLAALEKVRTVFCRLHNVESQNDEVRKRIFKFVEQLLELPQERLIRLKNNEASERLKSLAVCLNFEQTLTLFELIIKSPHSKELNARIFNRVVRISEMSDRFDFLKEVKAPKAPKETNRAYTLFQELVLPTSLELDYQKLYHEAYKNNKIKNILRQILVTLPPIEEYLIGCRVRNFTELLHRLELRYSTSEQTGGSDHIPTVVKIKYFLWLAKQENIQKICQEMIEEYKERIEVSLELYKNTKVEYLRALQSLKYYLDRASSRQKIVKEKRDQQRARDLIDSVRFRYCLSSPRSRQKEFGTNGKLVIPNYEKLIVDAQQNCIHTKGLEQQQPMNSKLHAHTVYEFVDAFCSLEEVRSAVTQGQDKVGINTNIFWFLGVVVQIVGKEAEFATCLPWLKEYTEDLVTRRIYELIFPRKPTYKDLALYTRIRSLEWLMPSHLSIPKRNCVEQVWQIAKRCLNDMEKSTCTNEKFNSIKQFLRIINGLLFINQDNGTMDNIYPMIVYTLVRTKPSRLNSNLNFIELFTEPGKMLSSEGYCFTSMKSAVMYVENLNEKNIVGITLQEMESKIYESELKMGIPFLRRNKSSSNFATMGQLREMLDS